MNAFLNGMHTSATGYPGHGRRTTPKGAKAGENDGPATTPPLSESAQQRMNDVGAQTGRNNLERGLDKAIGAYNSRIAQNAMTFGPILTAAAGGGMTAMAGGAGTTGIIAAASSAALPVAAATAVGMVSAYVGSKVGEHTGRWVMEGLGFQRIAEDGEMPATVGHPIAHKSGWSFGAMLTGAVVAVGVGAFIVATGGTGLAVICLAAAAGGGIAGIGAGFASVAGQYGSNKGEISQGSPNVFFNNKPVARVSDLVTCSEHGEEAVAEGAETVFANSLPIARIGHKTTKDGTINDGHQNIAIDINTSAHSLEIDVGWMQRTTDLALIAIDVLPGIASKVNEGRNKNRPSVDVDGDAPANACTKVGCPVDVATGQFFDYRTDLSIPGTIPLRLVRRPSLDSFGIQGRNWAGSWAQHLRVKDETITYQNHEGALITYYAPDEEVLSENLRYPHLELIGHRSAELCIFNHQEQLFYIFNEPDQDIRRLTKIQDKNGNKIEFIYDYNGLSRVEHSDGFNLHVSSEHGLIRHAQLEGADAKECDFYWSYNHRGQLTEVRSAQTGHLRYKYDKKGRIIAWHDAKDTRVYYEYGPDERIIKIWSDSGHAGATFEYDLENKRTITRNAKDEVTLWEWNDDGVVWRMTDPLGHVWLTEWDRSYHVTATVDPLGNKTSYSYDKYGNLTSLVDADGRTMSWDYGQNGRLEAFTDPAGNRSEYRHDKNGNLVRATDPLGRVFSLRLGSRGEVLRVCRPGDIQERLFYDPLMRLNRRIDSDGNEIGMSFDTEGRLRSFTDPQGASVLYDCTRGPENPRGNIRHLQTADGAVSTINYDIEGSLSSITGPTGNVRYFRYGAFELPIETVDMRGHRLRFEHDSEMRLTAVINEMGERYEYVLDAAGLVISEKDYSGLITEYKRDAAGRVIEKIEPNGARTEFSYTPAGRLIKLCVEDALGRSETNLDYDARGLLVRAENASAVVEYDYDALGRVVAERLNGREITSEYSVSGQRIKRSGDVLNLTQSWTNAGLPVNLGIGDFAPLSFTHDARGLEQMRHSERGFMMAQSHTITGNLAEQVAGSVAQLLPEMPGLGGGQIEPVSMMAQAGANAHRRYAWDLANRAIEINDQHTGTRRIQYDDRSQVAAVSQQKPGGQLVVTEYEYDPAKNIAAIVEADHGRQSFQTVAGRVHRRGGRVSYKHDDCGRVIEKRIVEPGFRPRIWRMAWNGHNQLIALKTPDGEYWHYAYDPFGRRVTRFAENGVGYAYQWEGDQLIAEAPMTADGTVLWDDARHWVYETGSLRPLAQVDAGELNYIVTDHMGTPREMLSEDGEAIIWRAELSLWGKLAGGYKRKAANDDAPPKTCPIRFQGQWHDEESGLHYNRFRYYDPDAAQYLSPDPIGLAGGVRPQGYVDDPNGWVDPLGLNGERCPDADNDGTGSNAPKGTPIEITKAKFGHTFETHGEDATNFLTNRARGSGQQQGQFLDDQAAARFIMDNLDKVENGAVSLPVPEGLNVRVINPDGTFSPAKTIRLVPGGKGVKTAYPEP